MNQFRSIMRFSFGMVEKKSLLNEKKIEWPRPVSFRIQCGSVAFTADNSMKKKI